MERIYNVTFSVSNVFDTSAEDIVFSRVCDLTVMAYGLARGY